MIWKRDMRRVLPASVIGAFLAAGLCGPATAVDANHGKVLFEACAACHSDGGNTLGPTLKGVFGRKSATVEDFRYSPAMTRANLVWDEANLRDFIIDPQAKVKGNRMPFGGIGNPTDVDDLVTYLKSYK